MWIRRDDMIQITTIYVFEDVIAGREWWRAWIQETHQVKTTIDNDK